MEGKLSQPRQTRVSVLRQWKVNCLNHGQTRVSVLRQWKVNCLNQGQTRVKQCTEAMESVLRQWKVNCLNNRQIKVKCTEAIEGELSPKMHIA